MGSIIWRETHLRTPVNICFREQALGADFPEDGMLRLFAGKRIPVYAPNEDPSVVSQAPNFLCPCFQGNPLIKSGNIATQSDVSLTPALPTLCTLLNQGCLLGGNQSNSKRPLKVQPGYVSSQWIKNLELANVDTIEQAKVRPICSPNHSAKQTAEVALQAISFLSAPVHP